MLEIIPNTVDPDGSALLAFLDKEELARHLNLFLSDQGQRASLPDARIRVLRWHKKNRCTMEITLETYGIFHELIGKIYAVNRSDTYRMMRTMWREGFDQSAKYSIPQPLMYMYSLRLLLQENVAGTSVREIFLGSDRHKQFEAAERSAHWLAYFHKRAPRLTQASPAEKQVARMKRWTRRLAELGDPVTEKSKQLFEKLEAEYSQLRGTEFTACHNSYSPDHVLLADGRTAVIDWDSNDVGDPARDLAMFVVATQRLALCSLSSIRALDSLADAFLQTYMAERGAGVFSRLRFYRAAMCLKVANYCAFNRQVPRWEKNVAAMVDEGVRVLGN
jgi:aminoglycoside phosphotransferase (APT) family kinase protein